ATKSISSSQEENVKIERNIVMIDKFFIFQERLIIKNLKFTKKKDTDELIYEAHYIKNSILR
ncbi:MAG: hypothetical protein P8N54_06615, partial [Flavobacteriales bacterium]|nr:hypothetical protein [Flavobacteriales bacterium]